MGDPVKVGVEKEVLKDLLMKTRQMIGPRAKYVPHNESFLKGIISEQEDRANEMNTILTNLLYPG